MQSFRLKVKVYSIDGVTPVIHPLSFVHPEAGMRCNPTR